jgi:hypothetical protein
VFVHHVWSDIGRRVVLPQGRTAGTAALLYATCLDAEFRALFAGLLDVGDRRSVTAMHERTTHRRVVRTGRPVVEPLRLPVDWIQLLRTRRQRFSREERAIVRTGLAPGAIRRVFIRGPAGIGPFSPVIRG